jgi:hypothetical protein
MNDLYAKYWLYLDFSNLIDRTHYKRAPEQRVRTMNNVVRGARQERPDMWSFAIMQCNVSGLAAGCLTFCLRGCWRHILLVDPGEETAKYVAQSCGPNHDKNWYISQACGPHGSNKPPTIADGILNLVLAPCPTERASWCKYCEPALKSSLLDMKFHSPTSGPDQLLS